jgi:hypothetical protein
MSNIGNSLNTITNTNIAMTEIKKSDYSMLKNNDRNTPNEKINNVTNYQKLDQKSFLQSLNSIFDDINRNASDLAEKIFEHLVDIEDEKLRDGKIPLSNNYPEINNYISTLNRLFRLSLRDGTIAIKRDVVSHLDKKTFTLAMVADGGASLDILCEIVNEENSQRTPQRSPSNVKITRVFNSSPKLFDKIKTEPRSNIKVTSKSENKGSNFQKI